MSAVYKDESGTFEIDLSFAEWSIGSDLHNKFKTVDNFLNDVDWVAETTNELFLIEFKHFSTPKGNLDDIEKFYQKILRKYYCTAYYLMACGKQKVMNYYFVAEAPNLDKVIGKRMKASVHKRLPFNLQQSPEISDRLISEFKVLSVSEWNEQYPMFPLRRCVS